MKKIFCLLILGCLLAAGGSAALADEAVTGVLPGHAFVPMGTLLDVEIASPVNSGDLAEGDIVYFKLQRGLSIAGVIVVPAGAAGEALDRIEALARRAGFDLAAPLAGLQRHLGAFPANAVTTFDAAFSPTLDYYTGLVFEVTGEGGHVLISGGQYDRLLERLGAPTRIAASGCAVWVDRLEREATES